MNNYEEIDKILSAVEEVFLSLAAKHKLKQVNIERWRWDEPVITLAWVGDDSISRNIHALIRPEGSYFYKLLVEINAWQDEDREGGKMRVRHWQRKEVGQFPPQKANIEQAVNEGYMEASRLSKTEMKETLLTPKIE